MTELIELDLSFSPDRAASHASDSEYSDQEIYSNPFSTWKGKGRAKEEDSPYEELEEEPSPFQSRVDLKRERSRESNAGEQSASVSALPAKRKKAEGCPDPAIGDAFEDLAEMKKEIPKFALQKGFKVSINTYTALPAQNPGLRLVSLYFKCLASRDCTWTVRGKEASCGGEIKVFYIDLEHSHALGKPISTASTKISTSSAPKRSLAPVDEESAAVNFPRQAEIVQKARELLKSSTGPLQQNHNLRFSSALEMRIHITAYSAQEGFTVSKEAMKSVSKTSPVFALRCYRGQGNDCSYRFRSSFDAVSKMWIVEHLEPSHSHPLGEYEYAGGIARKVGYTRKGRAGGRESEYSSSNEGDDHGGGEEVEVEKVSKSKVERGYGRQSIGSASGQNARPQVAVTQPRSVPSVPILPTSSPEWIAELTILITAIDHRLSNLVTIFDNAGVKNERAVKEMLNFSEDGLTRLTEKLMVPVAGMPVMTIMQGIWFKKGVKKIREGMA